MSPEVNIELSDENVSAWRDIADHLLPSLPVVGQDVLYLGCTDSQAAWGYGYADHSVLVAGEVYWVSRIEQHSMHTKVWLGEGDLGPFNSVCFEPLPSPGAKIEP